MTSELKLTSGPSDACWPSLMAGCCCQRSTTFAGNPSFRTLLGDRPGQRFGRQIDPLPGADIHGRAFTLFINHIVARRERHAE